MTRPFGRRCGWCGRTLRAWQINHCRRCHAAIEEPIVRSSPGPAGHGWNAAPDRWTWGRIE